MRIGIIGGGMMGLATAFYLCQKGLDVTVLEKEDEIGGLSRSQAILPDLRWDRFYHVILTADSELLKFLDDIGLKADIRFRETFTGFYAGGELHSMSSTWEFIKFKPLSMSDKLRLGLGIIYTSKLNDWRRLEKLYVKTWLLKVFGRRNYEKMWEPLLRSKLGGARNEASAAFIWATIKRLYGTRQSSSKKEMMGSVLGGYFSILNHARDRILESGGRILLNHGVHRIREIDSGRVLLENDHKPPLGFDRVVATTSNPALNDVLSDIPDDFRNQLASVQYLAVVCVTVVLRRQLTPFYITNIIDSGLPFTGVIEATHIVPPEVLNGRGLVYLPRYMPPGDPYLEKADDVIADVFISKLMAMFPYLSDGDILGYRINRETNVQPLQEIRYSERIPPIRTPLKHVFMVNTSMILNSTLNNNQVIKLAKRAVDHVSKSL